MRLQNYLTELSSHYGAGLTFVDIDEVLFKTFAMIYVIKGGEVVKKLTNQEYNTYELKPGESFTYDEFRDSKRFKKTSEPIQPMIDRLKRMFVNIERRDSKVMLITARSKFKNMKDFFVKFRQHKIPIEKIEVLLSPDKRITSISEWKKRTIMGHISTGNYRRVRLIDDAIGNLKSFLSIEKEIPLEVIERIKEKHKVTGDERIPVIEFYALHVDEKGKLRRIK